MLCHRLVIRETGAQDGAAIRKVETAAYGRRREANLVSLLLPAPPFTLSLLAECDGEPVGHVLLTEITAPVRALALAPLAVIPRYREMQVGSELVRHALARARKAGFEAVFVLGANPFYERFGFSSPLADPFEVSWQGRNFMALELTPGCLAGKSGRLDYPMPFLDL